jgi:hypothetical protein
MLRAAIRRLLVGRAPGSCRRTGAGIPRCHHFGDILDFGRTGPGRGAGYRHRQQSAGNNQGIELVHSRFSRLIGNRIALMRCHS